jgi:hypothetical protein
MTQGTLRERVCQCARVGFCRTATLGCRRHLEWRKSGPPSVAVLPLHKAVVSLLARALECGLILLRSLRATVNHDYRKPSLDKKIRSGEEA